MLIKNSRGIALIMVLWVIMLLTVMATSFAVSMRTETSLSYQLVISAKAKALAEAGVYRTVLELLKPVGPTKWQANGTEYRWKFGGGLIKLKIEDETGKIDLNAASPPLLESLFKAVGVGEGQRVELVDAIIDWRDTNNAHQLHGAEDMHYHEAGLDYGAKDGLFNTVSELQQVLGMTPAIYKKVAPALTVHSHQEGINLKTAIPQVKRLMNRVNEQPSNLKPADADSEFATQQNSFSDSAVFTINSVAEIPGGGQYGIRTTIKLTYNPEKPYTVIEWREG